MSQDLHHVCPWCLHEHDAVTNLVGDAGPDEGDPGICIDCGGVFTFDGRGGARRPTESERIDYASDRRLLQAVAAVKASLAVRRSQP